MAVQHYAGDTFVGLSTDVKPLNVIDGARFYESDPPYLVWLKVSGVWVNIGTSGAGISGYSGYSGFSGFSGESTTYIDVNQVSHGFVIGDVLRFDGTNYVKALADTPENAEVVGIVSQVIDSDNFKLLTEGEIDGLSGLLPGYTYFLDLFTPGTYSTTDPNAYGAVSKPLMDALSTTKAYFHNWRGVIVENGLGDSGYSGYSGVSGFSGTSGTSGFSGSGLVIRQPISASSTTTSFYFNSNVYTGDKSISPNPYSAFIVNLPSASQINICLRQEGVVGGNSTIIQVFKSANGDPLGSTSAITPETVQTVGENTMAVYSFSGLTINQYDALFLRCIPATSGSSYYGVVTIE